MAFQQAAEGIAQDAVVFCRRAGIGDPLLKGGHPSSREKLGIGRQGIRRLGKLLQAHPEGTEFAFPIRYEDRRRPWSGPSQAG